MKERGHTSATSPSKPRGVQASPPHLPPPSRPSCRHLAPLSHAWSSSWSQPLPTSLSCGPLLEAQCRYYLHSKPQAHPCPGGQSFWAQDLLPSEAGSSRSTLPRRVTIPIPPPHSALCAKLALSTLADVHQQQGQAMPFASKRNTSHRALMTLCLRTFGRCGTLPTQSSE